MARLEQLEDRLALASSIAIIAGAAGTGDQDANLLADGQILFADPDIGANTLSSGALTAIAATANILVQSTGVITFNSLAGTLTLQTGTGNSASFSTDVAGGGDIAFATATDALATSGGSLSFSAGGNLVLAGLNSGGGAIDLAASATLQANNSSAIFDIDAGTGTLSMTAGSPGNDALLTVAQSAAVRGLGGVMLTADGINVADFGRIDSGDATTILRPFEDGTGIDLGGPDAVNTLGLTLFELDGITAGLLQIGDGDEADILVSSPIGTASANWHILTLRTAGGIVDGTPGEQHDIGVNGGLALHAGTGIGAADDLDIDAFELAFENIAGAVNIEDRGGITIDSVDGLTSSSNTGTTTTISAFSALTLAADITTTGNTTYTNRLNDLIVDSGVTLEVVAGNLRLEAGERMHLGANSTLKASGTVVLSFEIGNQIVGGHGAQIQGLVDAGVGIPTVIGGVEQDGVVIDYSRGANLPDGLIFQDSGGLDLLSIRDDGGQASHSYALSDSAVIRDATTISLAGVEIVQVVAGDLPDTFNVVVSPVTQFVLDGNGPGRTESPGDSLNLDITGATGAVLFVAPSGSSFYSFSNRLGVGFRDFESWSPTAKDLQITKSDGVGATTPGSTLTYVLSYANVGDLDAPDVAIRERPPAGTTFNAAASSPGWTETPPGSGVFFLNVGALPAHASGTAQFAVTVNSPVVFAQDQIVNTATISDRRVVHDPSPLNNTAFDITELWDVNLFAVGADAGGGPHVRVFNDEGPHEKFAFFAFDPNFTGGVRVATGDVTGDGTPDIIAAAGPGAGPHVRVFDGITGGQVPGAIGSFYAYDPAFTGGVFVASADFNQDGFADVLTGPGIGGGPHIRVFSGRDGAELVGFLDKSKGSGGVRVATGDIDGDGTPDIIAAGASDTLRVFAGLTGQEIAGAAGRIVAYPGFGGGVFVASGDVNGDGRDDVITGAGAGGGPHVRAFSGVDGRELASFFAYDAAFSGGVRVGAGDVDQDGDLEIITGAGPGGGPHVRAFDVLDDGEVASFFAFSPAFAGGVFVAGSPTIPGVPNVTQAIPSQAPAAMWLDTGDGESAPSPTPSFELDPVQPVLPERDLPGPLELAFTGSNSLPDWSTDHELPMLHFSAAAALSLTFSWPELADLVHGSGDLL